MSTTRRLTILIVPYAIFAAALLPWPGLLHRALSYQSTNNAPLWSMLNCGNIFGQIGWIWAFGGSMVLLGLLLRRRSPLSLYCYYTCCLVAFSTALANHYLVIPVAALAIGWNRFALGYYVVGSAFEIASDQGLHWQWLEQYMHCSGDGTGAKPWYALLCLLLLLHVATREG